MRPIPISARLSARWLLRALLASWMGLASWANSQEAPCLPNNSGFSPHLPPPPEKGPRPVTGPASVAAFVDSVSTNDSVFEVVVGQGRILTTKRDIAVRGKAQP